MKLEERQKAATELKKGFTEKKFRMLERHIDPDVELELT
jgi:hypothetical protein